MNGANTNIHASELIYEDILPLTWRMEKDNALEGYAFFNEPNFEFLRILFALEDHQTEIKPEVHDEFALEIMHLDAKLNLLLGMMGRMLIKQTSLPPSVPIRLSRSGIQWSINSSNTDISRTPDNTPGPPRKNESVLVEVYLRPDYPLPVVFPTRVDSVVRETGGIRICTTFHDINEPVQELLERAIFRRHRRMIAMTRGNVI